MTHPADWTPFGISGYRRRRIRVNWPLMMVWGALNGFWFAFFWLVLR